MYSKVKPKDLELSAFMQFCQLSDSQQVSNPPSTGTVLSKSTKGELPNTVFTALLRSPHSRNVGHHWQDERLQNTTESMPSEIPVKPVVNEFTHRRRV